MPDPTAGDPAEVLILPPAPEKTYTLERPILGLDFAVGETVADSQLPPHADRDWLKRTGVLREFGAPRLLPEVVTITEQTIHTKPGDAPDQVATNKTSKKAG